MAITTSVLDDFNRSNTGPPPSTLWDGPVASGEGGLKVVSNALAPNASGSPCSSYWKTAFGAPCEVYATISNNAGEFELYCRLSNAKTSTPSAYCVYISPPNSVIIYKIVNGTYTDLGAAIEGAISNGTKIGLSAIGTTITLWRDTGSGWSSVTTRTDSSITGGGYIGALIYSAGGTARLDDFGGGTAIQTIAASGLTATLTAGSPTITPGAVNIAATGLELTATFGSPVIATAAGEQTIAASGLELTATIGSPTLTVGAVDIAASGLELTATIGQPTVTPGAVDVQATGLELTAALGTPTITPGAVDIAASGLEITATIGSPVISSGVVITASGLELTATLGTPAITTGAVNIDATGLEITAVFGSATITGGLVIVPATDGVGELSLYPRDIEFILPTRDSIFSLPARDNVPARDMVLEVEER